MSLLAQEGCYCQSRDTAGGLGSRSTGSEAIDPPVGVLCQESLGGGGGGGVFLDDFLITQCHHMFSSTVW